MTKKFSVVLETENLGMAGLEDLEKSLESLQKQDFSIKNAEEVLIIIGSHVSREIQDKLKDKYPWVRLHLVNGALDYAKSKMIGAEVAKGEIVVFCDSDMRYEKGWLSNMVKAFDKYPDDVIMSGDTRLSDTTVYEMSLNLSWMIQLLSDKITSPVRTAYFPLNNFAIKKSDIIKNPIPYHLPLYRNKIPIWERQLIMNGLSIRRVPGSRGYHAPPGNFVDWALRMLIYGSDFVALSDFSLNEDGGVKEKRNMAKRLFRFLFLFPWKIEQIIINSWKLIAENFNNIKYITPAILLAFVNISVIQFGALCGLINRNYLFNLINARESGHVV